MHEKKNFKSFPKVKYAAKATVMHARRQGQTEKHTCVLRWK